MRFDVRLTVLTAIVRIYGFYKSPVDNVRDGKSVVDEQQRHGQGEIFANLTHQTPDSSNQQLISLQSHTQLLNPGTAQCGKQL